jgi:competence protein ComEC
LENPLFGTRAEAIWFWALLSVIFLFTLTSEYQNFKKIKEYPYYKTTAEVRSVNIRDRNGSPYSAIELRCEDGQRIFCAQRFDASALSSRSVKVIFDSSKIGFVDFLKGSRAKVFELVPLEHEVHSLKHGFYDFIASQHEDADMRELFVSLFFETRLSDKLQQKINDFGLSAVMSLSGLNLTLLSALIFFVLAPLYKLLQERYFPYRDRNLDITVVVLVMMSFYAYLTGFADPFIRALAMAFIAFWLISRGVRITNLATLGITIVTILAFSPRAFFSLGFWLSVIGVYFIFLFLKHTKKLANWAKIALLSIFVYTSMGVIARSIFGGFSPWQITSPVTSMIFDFFYPVAVVLHIVGFGWLFDGIFEKALLIPTQSMILLAPWWFSSLFVVVSIAAWRSELAFWLTAIFGVLFTFSSFLSFFY